VKNFQVNKILSEEELSNLLKIANSAIANKGFPNQSHVLDVLRDIDGKQVNLIKEQLAIKMQQYRPLSGYNAELQAWAGTSAIAISYLKKIEELYNA